MGNNCDNCGNAWQCEGKDKTKGCIGWIEMPKRVMTNRQWLESLTDEELIKWLQAEHKE